jgi:formylglycine-generating enzyme required for sulfatase activity
MRHLTPLLLAVLLPALAQAGETRVALVIGNSAYASGPLPNPANDAALMKETLRKIGFEVIERQDADQVKMKRAIQEFGSRLEKGGPEAVGLFYYAGHGVQLNGRNYLIPTTANIEREADVEIEAVSADWVIEQMRYARNRLNIVILDACRNNPFTRSMRSADRGLATMDAPAGILIAYSTAPGSVAQDGNGRNSPYTTALTQAMLERREPVEQVFKHVRVDVIGVTAGKQVPWESSSLTGDFCFGSGNCSSPPPPPPPDIHPTPSQPGLWASLTTWVSGLFSGGPGTGPNPVPPIPVRTDSTIDGARAVSLLSSLGIQTGEVEVGRSYPQADIRHLVEGSSRRVRLGSSHEQLRSALELCRQYSGACAPSMFADEKPRDVILRPFELDATPVSVRAFRQFADTSGYRTRAEQTGRAYVLKPDGMSHEEVPGASWRNGLKRHPVDDDSPVVGVSFADAQAYCQAKGARLPTENEWEYAARGPKRTIFPWGDDSAPVARAMGVAPHVTDGPPEGIGGRYKGLSGNVWQWVDTRLSGATLLKGGSWLEANPANKRAATRRYENPAMADEDSGFRCARSVTAWPDAEVWLSQLQ